MYQLPQFICRSRPLALAVALALTGSAHGAGLSLIASGNEAYLCHTIIERAYGAPMVSKPERIDSHEPVAFYIGSLPPGEHGDSPQFRRLTLRCWLRAPTEFEVGLGDGEASYSISFDRESPLWDLGAANGVHDYWPPHDRRMVRFTLQRTDNPAAPLHIASASVIDEIQGFRDYAVPNGFLTLSRD